MGADVELCEIRLFRPFLATLLLCVSVTAQQKVPPAKPSPPAVPVFDVKLSLDPNLSVGLPDDMPAISTQCDADGNPYVYTFGPSGRQILGLTPKGVITFATNQMTDIPEPAAGDFFVADSAVYVLVTGIEYARKDEVAYKDEAGQETKQLETKGESGDYIARFDSDGSYRGALKLDAGFHPIQVAAFGSGNFVLAGLDEGKTPRVGLFNSSGQLVKYLELAKDITDRPKSAEKSFEHSGLHASVDVIAMFAKFYSYHGNVLLVRAGNTTPIYEIRESGEVRAVRVKAPNGVAIDHLIPSDHNWFIDVRKGSLEEKTDTIYEVSPETGELLREYRIESEDRLKEDLSCVIQDSFSGIRHQQGRLTVLRGVAEPAKRKAVAAPP
jgi:hypothetical protein